jgi:hypothetical protein
VFVADATSLQAGAENALKKNLSAIAMKEYEPACTCPLLTVPALD